MSIAVGNNTTQDLGTTPTTVTLTMPTGAGASSIVIVVIAGENDSTANTSLPGRYTPPSGWTSANGYSSQSVLIGGSWGPIGLEVWWSLGNNSNLVWTATNGTGDLSATKPKYMGLAAVNFTGVDLTTPIDATGTNNQTSASNTQVSNAVTIVTNQAWHLIGMADWNAAGGAFSATSFTAVDNAGANAATGLLYNSTPKSVGSTGTVTVTGSGGTAANQRINTIPFALRPASGSPTNYTRTVTDNLGGQTTASRLAGSLRTSSDNLGGNTTTATQSAQFRSVADNLGIQDAVSRLVASFRLVSDSLAIADILVLPGFLLIHIAETLGLITSASTATASSRLVSDLLGLMKLASTASASSRTVSNQLGVSTSATSSAASRRSVSDSTGVQESPFRTDQPFVPLSDSIGMSTAALRAANALRAAADLLAFTDSTRRSAAGSRAITELVGVSTAFSNAMQWSRLCTDNIAIAELVTLLDIPVGLLIIRITELLALSDSVASQQDANRQISELAGIANLFGSAADWSRSVEDLVGDSDTVARQVDSYRLISDSIGLISAAEIILSGLTAGTPGVGWYSSDDGLVPAWAAFHHMYVDEVRQVWMDFGPRSEIVAGDSIDPNGVSVVLSGVELAAGTITVNGTRALVSISAIEGGTCQVQFVANTLAGSVLAATGSIRITDLGTIDVPTPVTTGNTLQVSEGWYAADNGLVPFYRGPYHKAPAETKRLFMDFSPVAEILAGDIASSVRVGFVPSGPGTQDVMIDGGRMLFTVTGGTTMTEYQVVVTATTDDGTILVRAGQLRVV